MQDSCFDGYRLPSLRPEHLSDPSIWKWHILGQRLPEGTECQFNATVEDSFNFEVSRLQMSTSCTISGNDSLVTMPATCSEPISQDQCPCQCSEGFRTSDDVQTSLACESKTANIILDNCSSIT